MSQSIVPVTDITSLSHVRVTGVGGYRECPKAWVTRTFELVPERKSPYAAVGTSVHAVIEAYLRKQHDGPDDPRWGEQEVTLRAAGVRDSEIENLRGYIRSLEEWRDSVIVIEHEFKLEMPGFGLPIMGHQDVVFALADGALMIVDHKTNRKYADQSWWAKQFQPRLYAWAARKLWPQYHNVWYQIGYVNLGTVVRWQTSPSDDEATEHELRAIWEEMLAHNQLQDFPERFNDGCGWCPLHRSCATFSGELDRVREGFLSSVADQPLAERYLWAQRVRKAAEQLEGNLKKEILEQMELTSGEALEGEGVRLVRALGTKRTAPFSAVWAKVRGAAEVDPDFEQAMVGEVDKIFSVRVTGLDDVAKRVPMLKPLLAEVVRPVPNSEYAIKVQPVQNMPVELQIGAMGALSEGTE